MPSSTRPKETAFRLPDLWTDCPFPLVSHKNESTISIASEKWIQQGVRKLSPDIRRHMVGLKAGTLSSYCYHECSDDRFRVVCDFMNVFFLLDDLSDPLMSKDADIFATVIMNAITFPECYLPSHAHGEEQLELEPDASSLTRDYWKRLIPGIGPYVLKRLTQSMELYLAAVREQAQHRDKDCHPDVKEFVQLRRLSSGTKPLFDLIEYSLDIELPEHIVDDPLMMTLKDCVNDFVGFTNDIFSYNVEQSRGDDHNLVTALMNEYNLDVQGAVDRAAEMSREALDKYCVTKAQFPSYGPELDRQVDAFLRGLEGWLSGGLEWSFVTHRYFGSQGSEVKKHRWVKLLPVRAHVEKAT